VVLVHLHAQGVDDPGDGFVLADDDRGG
jgi:hypothetical protein